MIVKNDIKRICNYLGIGLPKYSGKTRTIYVNQIPNNQYGDYLRHILNISPFNVVIES